MPIRDATRRAASQAAYYASHKAERAAYRSANKETIAAVTKTYRIVHKERSVMLGRAYRTAHRAVIAARYAARAAALKLAALKAYGGPKCVCCGETLFEGLSLDHINGDGAKHRAATRTGGTSGYSLLKKIGYPKGFQVMCMTCNFAKGTGDHCPHESRRVHGAALGVGPMSPPLETIAAEPTGILLGLDFYLGEAFPDEISAEFSDAQDAQDYAGGDDGYDDPGEVGG